MARPKREFKICHDDDLCKRCGICAAFCPRECLAQDERGNITVIAEEKCIGCRLCEIRCPDMAIEVFEKAKT